MLEFVVWSLFVGSLGLQAAVIGGGMHWQQITESRQDEEEEEILTQYETKDNAADKTAPQQNAAGKALPKDPRLVGWEFKIVRAHRHIFRDPAVFQRLCQEEAEAGWIMLEKLDDRRVRFKRPIALREIVNSEFLKQDPYRCHYGSSWQPLTWFAAIATLVAIVLPAYLGYVLVTQGLTNSRQNQTIPDAFPSSEQLR
jgi:hypothetical protein